MKAHRSAGLLVAFAVTAAGCGGGTSSQPEAAPSTTATTSAPATTTTLPPATTPAPTTLPPTTTTTLPPTTTTTLVPWHSEALGDPGMPEWVWETRQGDLVSVGSICLEWVHEGTTRPYEGVWVDDLTTKLAILGVSVVPGGCDVTLQISMTATRTSALYGLQRRECWSGESLEAEAALLVDGEADRTWALVDRTSRPPDTIESWECDDEDEPVGPTKEEGIEWWHTIFSDLFAVGANLATWIEDAPDGGPACWEGLPGATEARALSSLLVNPDHFLATRDWVAACLTADLDGREALWPMIPYLIMSDWREKLEAITGETFGSREEWWAWWEAHREG